MLKIIRVFIMAIAFAAISGALLHAHDITDEPTYLAAGIIATIGTFSYAIVDTIIILKEAYKKWD